MSSLEEQERHEKVFLVKCYLGVPKYLLFDTWRVSPLAEVSSSVCSEDFPFAALELQAPQDSSGVIPAYVCEQTAC